VQPDETVAEFDTVSEHPADNDGARSVFPDDNPFFYPFFMDTVHYFLRPIRFFQVQLLFSFPFHHSL